MKWDVYPIPVVPGQAGGGSFQSIKKHKPIRTSKPIEKKIMHCKAAMVMGSRMQHGSAQPTAAHALQGKRNARVVGCDEDNAQPAAAYALQRYEILLIDPCLSLNAILSLYWFYWLRTLYVIQ